ncbi:MAG: NUDIX hydrolase [Akkermansiaceae bacterium]|nr:NUDIX hydrolase [Armatimonadota bacterium]
MGETPEQAVVREETGTDATVLRPLFSEPYSAGTCVCYLLTVAPDQHAMLGYDPEEEGLEAAARLLQEITWQPVVAMRDDGQVAQVLATLQNGPGRRPRLL